MLKALFWKKLLGDDYYFSFVDIAVDFSAAFILNSDFSLAGEWNFFYFNSTLHQLHRRFAAARSVSHPARVLAREIKPATQTTLANSQVVCLLSYGILNNVMFNLNYLFQLLARPTSLSTINNAEGKQRFFLFIYLFIYLLVTFFIFFFSLINGFVRYRCQFR